jgi:hypothetical protein
MSDRPHDSFGAATIPLALRGRTSKPPQMYPALLFRISGFGLRISPAPRLLRDLRPFVPSRCYSLSDLPTPTPPDHFRQIGYICIAISITG